MDSDTHVIANVVCKIQGFEFLQNIQNCEVINDYISNDLYYIFIIYKVTKKAHLIHLKCAIHATYCLLTDYVGSFTEKETTEIHGNFIKCIIFHSEKLLHIASKKVLVTFQIEYTTYSSHKPFYIDDVQNRGTYPETE